MYLLAGYTEYVALLVLELDGGAVGAGGRQHLITLTTNKLRIIQGVYCINSHNPPHIIKAFRGESGEKKVEKGGIKG